MPTKEYTNPSRKRRTRRRGVTPLDISFPVGPVDHDILPRATVQSRLHCVRNSLVPAHIADHVAEAALEVVDDQPGITAYDATRQAIDIAELEDTGADNLMDLGRWQRGGIIEQFWNWALGKRNDLEKQVEELSFHRRHIAPLARMAIHRGINSALVREYEHACAALLNAQDELELFTRCEGHIDQGEDDSMLDADDPAVLLLWERFARIFDIGVTC